MAIDFLFGWASGNNIDIPKKSNGETDIGKLFEMYNNEMNNLAKKTSPEKVEQDLFLKIMDKDYLQQMNAEEIKKAISVDLNKEKRQKELIQFVQNIKDGKPTQKRMIIAEIKNRERKDIENLLGENLKANVHTLGASEVKHIINRHGENGKHDKSMSDINDYTLIEDVLHNYDVVNFIYEKGNIKTTSAYADKNNKPARLIQFTKVVNDKFVHVVEAITDGKYGDIRIMSAYKAKRGE